VTSPGETLLEVRGLATGYHDIRAVWDVSLRVGAGEVTVLLGRNGAGKTTTLRAVAGLNRADAGAITFNGRDVTGLPAHRRVGAGIGMVHEGKRVFRRRTVEENLLLGGYTRGLTKRKLLAELDPVYAMFPVLADRRHAMAGRLSGGQQQMLAIGQALLAKPALLMLDEPSGGLAPAVVADVMAAVATLKDSGIGVLLVEQAVTAALEVADRVTVLEVGRVVLDRPVAEIPDAAALTEAYFGRAR
jgi:branched-chain amino acid transport system ATP-binding protein